MNLDGSIKRLLDEVKYRHRFPPHEEVLLIKSKMVSQGLTASSALVQQVVGVYLRAVEKVLDDFTDSAASRRGAFGLSNNLELRAAVSAAHQLLFDEARGMVLDELRLGPDYQRLATSMVDGRRETVREHLERAIELRELDDSAQRVQKKEREQKFGILLSPSQAPHDFELWKAEGEKWGNPITILFLDIDNFKALNEQLTHTKVDQTILPNIQRTLAGLVQGRGEAYRYGGEEFLLVLPNLNEREAEAFAEKVRQAIERGHLGTTDTADRVTVSIGVGVWPTHGATFQTVLEAANRAEIEAKKTKNTVRMAAQ